MTGNEGYPRDMIGYGRTPPFADWPNRARVAVQFVINYEEGGENNILHGDAASEAFLSEIVGAAPWPGMRHMNMESIYEYGSRAGFWRLHRMFTERSVPVTVYAVATAMARNREAVAAMNEAGWEIATHGLKWIDYRDTPPEVEARHIAEAVRIHTEVAGVAAARLLSGALVDQHHPARHGGRRLPLLRRRLRRRPALLARRAARAATDHALHARLQRHAIRRRRRASIPATSSTPISRIRSTRSTPRATSRRKCCRSACTAGSSAARAARPRWRDSSTTCSSHDRVWMPTRLDIARHWIRKHPPAGGWKPSRLTRTLFVERFGGVYEHSPWIAEAAYDAGLTAEADTAEGLARAMAAAAAKGTDDQKRALILAHPDLAGRLALAKTLTREVDAGAGERGARPAEPRRTREVHRAQRRLSRALRLPVHHGGQGQEQGRHPRRLRDAARQRSGHRDEDALAEIDRIAALRLKDILP